MVTVLTADGSHRSKAVSERGSSVNPLTRICGDVGPFTAYTKPPAEDLHFEACLNNI
jgi:hypothetical protein